MLKSESREIGGLEVTTTQFGAMEGFDVLAMVSEVLGPALSQFEGNVKPGESVPMSSIGKALAATGTSISKVGSKKFLTTLLKKTRVQRDDKFITLNTQASIDASFSSVGELIEALKFALEVNFGDFLSGAAGGLQSTGGQAEIQSE